MTFQVAGDYEPIVAAVKEVFTKFKDDANHADYTFVSYANAEYVPNAYPAGPAVAQGNAQGGEEAGPDPYGMAGGQMGAKMAPTQGYGASASMLGECTFCYLLFCPHFSWLANCSQILALA